MINFLKDYLAKQKQIIEIENELENTKELLAFSLDENEKKEKELKDNCDAKVKECEDLLKEILKVVNRNNYNRPEKMKLAKINELIRDAKPELTHM